jgi:hypothetical protein
MKPLILIAFTFIYADSIGQLNIQSSPSEGRKASTGKYDSTYCKPLNKSKALTGQELFCMPDAVIANFHSEKADPTWKKNFHPVGKYFQVLHVSLDTIYAGLHCTGVYKLLEKDNGDVIYFQYLSSWPFLVTGYFTRIANIYKNHSWFVQNDSVMLHDKWLCTDVIVDTNYYKDLRVHGIFNEYGIRLVFERNGAKHSVGTAASFNETGRVENKSMVIFPESAEDTYGDTLVSLLDKQIFIGWSKKLVGLSLGEPDLVKKDMDNDPHKEQWLYGTNALNFVNDKLDSVKQ